MKKYYVWDITTFIYAGSILCKEHDKPQNSTNLKPLPFKEGNEIVWDGEGWEYQPMN